MVFKVEYTWNGWVKKDGIRATLDTSINFAFCPRLTQCVSCKLNVKN